MSFTKTSRCLKGHKPSDTHKDKIYAGLVEAVIGSVFVIEGYQKSKQLIEKLFINQLEGLEAKDSLRMQKPFCKNIVKVSHYHCQNINVMHARMINPLTVS